MRVKASGRSGRRSGSWGGPGAEDVGARTMGQAQVEPPGRWLPPGVGVPPGRAGTGPPPGLATQPCRPAAPGPARATGHAARAVSAQPRRRPEADHESGFVGGFEALLFGFLLFVAGTLLIAHAWAIVDTKAAATEAARQAARTYVEAPSAALALTSAQAAADAALTGYGRDPGQAVVQFASGSFGRCQRVTISVSYPAPLLVLPFVGRVGTGGDVRAQNSELVDPYRTGLPGTATCT